jgi:hypothetical protein
MTVRWDDPLGGPDAMCRGCERGIWQRDRGWEDGDGIVVCVKAPLENIGLGKRPDYVEHQPMPTGLRGALRAAEP